MSLCFIWSLPSQADAFPATYDAQIERAVKRWWPDYPDARAWKAQLWQESRLQPNAVSPVGAAGIAQFMPGTWADVVRQMKLPRGASPHEAALAIEAGAYYMAVLRRQWSSPRAEHERHRLAQASYNAGLGNILKAQKRCGGAALWDDIATCLPAVTGKHSRETISYVRLIAEHRARMAAGGLR